MDIVRKTHEFLKGCGYTLNFQEVRAEVNRVLREGKQEILLQKMGRSDKDGVYEMLFGVN